MVLTVIVSGVVAMTVVPATSATGQDIPRFRSSVDLVSVAAVVRDRKGRFVRDLSRQDFEVMEAGERRPILDFRAEVNGPVKIAMLLDVSGSMRMGHRTADARQVATHLFSHLGSGDQAAVFAFDTALSEVQGFTSNLAVLTTAIETVDTPYGQTSLYDAIAQTARHVAAAGELQRLAVVVVTDGVDTRSRMTPGEVAKVASGIDVPVYIVAVAAGVDDPRQTRNGSQMAVASDLQQLARNTGGELFIASAPGEAGEVVGQMMGELRHQYVLAFEASPLSGWRPLEVRTRRDSHVIRARTGYTAGGPAEEESGRR
jgi:Ca-activated chloride channel homolog